MEAHYLIRLSLQRPRTLLSDKNRTHIVVSAPGKRHDEDIKVTDLLESCYELKIKLEIEKQKKL